MRGICVKVFGQAFFKRLAKSKGSAFGRPSQRAKSFFRRALRKELNLQNDPVDRFAKRGNPAREGSPLLANFTNYPFTEQVKTAYLDLVSSRLSASQSLTKGFSLYACRRGGTFDPPRRTQPPLQSGRPSAMLRAVLSAAVRPPLPTRSQDLVGTPNSKSVLGLRPKNPRTGAPARKAKGRLPEAWAKRCL